MDLAAWVSAWFLATFQLCGCSFIAFLYRDAAVSLIGDLTGRCVSGSQEVLNSFIQKQWSKCHHKPRL